MGDEKEIALLNYSDAYYIFKEFEDDKSRGICLANIGAIMMQKEDYYMAYVSFNLSCQILENLMYGDLGQEISSAEAQDSKTDFGINKFVLACR